MNDDKALLEAAARAAGMSGTAVEYDDRLVFLEDGKSASIEWNPLTDDGDALRLAIDLGINVADQQAGICWDDPDRYTKMRRSIVRAAASLGQEAAK